MADYLQEQLGNNSQPACHSYLSFLRKLSSCLLNLIPIRLCLPIKTRKKKTTEFTVQLKTLYYS